MCVRLNLVVLVALTVAVVAVVNGAITGRIVGGEGASIKQYPYQISLRIENRHTCGGSIISSTKILTAAHCVWGPDNKPRPAELYNIRAGSSNRIAGGIIVQVKKITVHESYSDGSFLNDVAILELEEELSWSDRIQPIALETEEVPSGSDVVISGWGLLATNDDSSPIMMLSTHVTALSKKQCFSKILMSEDSLICLDHNKGTGACSGDSGGPAVYQGKLVGVAGFVVLGCGSSRPDGYAKVSHHMNWIATRLL